MRYIFYPTDPSDTITEAHSMGKTEFLAADILTEPDNGCCLSIKVCPLIFFKFVSVFLKVYINKI